MTEAGTLPQRAGEPDIADIPSAGTETTRADRPAMAQPTLRMMEQSVHTMRQTSMTGLADGTSDYRSEVRVGVKRIVVSDLPAAPHRATGAPQANMLTVTPSLILGVVIGIGAALVASAVHTSAVVVGLCYALPVTIGLVLTVLHNSRRRRK